jgi:hypothetical protein
MYMIAKKWFSTDCPMFAEAQHKKFGQISQVSVFLMSRTSAAMKTKNGFTVFQWPIQDPKMEVPTKYKAYNYKA